jgi:hypothetical protein
MLQWFFEITHASLEEFFSRLETIQVDVTRMFSLGQRMQFIGLIRDHAYRSIGEIFSMLNRRLSGRMRRALKQAGTYGDTLMAKLLLLWEYIKEKNLKPIFATINSILGSLIKAIHVAEVVKEFKDALEIVHDSLGEEEKIIQLNLGLDPSRRPHFEPS